MDFSKVDWAHVVGWGVLGAGAVALLPVLPFAAPVLAGLSAAGVTVTAAGAGAVAAGVAAVSQAKGHADAAK